MHKKIKLLITLLLLTHTFLFAQDLELENIFKNKQVDGTIVIESLNTKKSIFTMTKGQRCFLVLLQLLKYQTV